MNNDHALVFTLDGDAHRGLPPAHELTPICLNQAGSSTNS